LPFCNCISCQKEEIELLQEQSNNQEKQLQQQIDFKNLPGSILQNFNERRSIKLKPSKKNMSFGAVRTDIPVIKQMGKGGVANYTFGLTKSSSQKSSSLYFDNFVVQELQSGKQMKYLIHYEPKENWYYNKNRDLANYSGRIKIYNIQAELVGNMDIANGELLPVQQQKMNDELECMWDLDSIWCIGDVNGGDTYSCYYHYTVECSSGSSGSGSGTNEDIPYESPSGGSWENDPTGGGSGDPDDTEIDTTPILDDKFDYSIAEYEAIVATFEENIDDSELADCLKAILNTLKGHDHGVGKFLIKFAGNDLGYNWNVRSETLNGISAAQTDPPSLYNGSLITKFDSNTWNRGTDLFWAKTILHESAHAYLSTYFARERPEWIATYPQMVDEYSILQGWNAVHYEEFSRSLISSMSIIIKEYGQQKGYDLSDSFYEDLVWGGLSETKAFKALSYDERYRILDLILIEGTGKNLSDEEKNQKGSDAGC